VYEYLTGHPDVFMSPAKEPLYFCPDVGNPMRRAFRFPESEARYLALFDGARSEKRLGEASTRYLVSHEAPGLIRNFQPRPYIVAMLRNPVDMIYALHNERVSQGHEDIEDFSAALAADEDRYAGRATRAGIGGVSVGYRAEGRYGEQLDRWIAAVGRERIHVIAFDDFVSRPEAEFERLLRFLEVDPTFRPPTFVPRNRSHRQRALVRAVLDSPPGEWVTHTAIPAIVGEQRRAALAYRFRHSRLNRRAAPRPPLAPELHERLEHDLRPDVERLSAMLGRDFVTLWFGAP
jgi:hypothetical protein